MLAGKLAEGGAVPPRVHDHRLDAVIRDELVVDVEGDRLVAAPAPHGVVRGEDALERLPELRVEYRVDDRVEGRIGVTQPREDLERDLRYARLAERRHDVDAEERHPAYEEDAHDDADGYGGLVIAHMVRRAVVVVQVNVQGLVLLLDALLLRHGALGEVDGARYRADVLHVFLRVTVQPTVDTCN